MLYITFPNIDTPQQARRQREPKCLCSHQQAQVTIVPPSSAPGYFGWQQSLGLEAVYPLHRYKVRQPFQTSLPSGFSSTYYMQRLIFMSTGTFDREGNREAPGHQCAWSKRSQLLCSIILGVRVWGNQPHKTSHIQSYWLKIVSICRARSTNMTSTFEPDSGCSERMKQKLESWGQRSRRWRRVCVGLRFLGSGLDHSGPCVTEKPLSQEYSAQSPPCCELSSFSILSLLIRLHWISQTTRPRVNKGHISNWMKKILITFAREQNLPRLEVKTSLLASL